MAEIMVRFDDLRRYCEKRHCGSVPLEYIKQMPTIEAIPVIYGVILETTDINGKPFKYCSNCKYPLPESNVMNYCNCCGSDFRSPDCFPFSKELAEVVADIVREAVNEQLKIQVGA